MGQFCLRHKKKKQNFNINILIDEKKEKNNSLGLKIIICGNLPEKDKVIKDLFKNEIEYEKFETRGTYQYKTDQFYWIAKTYEDLSENSINLIVNDIIEDMNKPKDEGPTIDQQVILCFGSKNIKLLIDKIKEEGDIYIPLFIIISEEEIKDIGLKDKRKITNIILNDKTRSQLNSRIISTLWKYDCYYNEKGNQICRYTPDNIFKSFDDISLSFYSLNILLIGKSRAGKSTFINYLSNKLNALESCKKESVSKKVTEYCIDLNNKDNKDSSSIRSCIKLFDTPGIFLDNNSEDKIDNLNKDNMSNKTSKDKKDDSKNKINEKIDNTNKDYINFLSTLLNNKNSIENQIHFILFFFMEGTSLQGIKEIFQFLNECNKPVLFVITKAIGETDDNDKSKDIKATISFLTKINCNNLIDENNYFGVNLVKSISKKNTSLDFGVEDIFKRIYQLLYEKKIFTEDNKEINNTINNLCKNYSTIFENPKEIQDIENKTEEQFKSDVSEIKNKLDLKFDMFKNINIENIINNGIISSNRCRNIINSLANLSEVLENIDESNLPAISYFQAFMVREIGEIFGFNFQEMKKEIDEYIQKQISLSDLSNYEPKKKVKKKENKIEEKMEININIIANYLKSEFEKSNKGFIRKLARMFNDMRNEEFDELEGNEEKIIKKKNQIDQYLTNGIFEECIKYLIITLEKSNGIFFFKNYFLFCQNLEKDLKRFSELEFSEHFGKKEMQIIKD